MKGKSTLILNHETIVEIVQEHLDKNVFADTQRQHIAKLKPMKIDQYSITWEYHLELVNQKDEFEKKLKGIQ